MNYSLPQQKYVPEGHRAIRLHYTFKVNEREIFDLRTESKKPVLRNSIELEFLIAPCDIERVKGEVLEHLNHFISATVAKAAQMQKVDSFHWTINTSYFFYISHVGSDIEAFKHKGDLYYNKPCDTPIEVIKGLISEHVNEFSSRIAAQLNNCATEFKR